METRNYGIDFELESRVQNVLNSMGTDVNTFVKNVFEKIANKELSPIVFEETIKPKKAKRPFEEMRDIYKGKIWIADDFDAPLECMKEYME